MELTEEFEFEFCNDPDFLIIGCYGQRQLPPGDYVKIGYYTENLAPYLENLDWFFGCEFEDQIRHPRYCRRRFGPIHPELLRSCTDPEKALRSKTKFCCYIYSNRVPLREALFRALSSYKFVHAPGASMHNVDDLSARESERWHEDKLEYLRQFKFVIAFENSVRPGYCSEKITDAYLADATPVYFGDPEVGRVFDSSSFVNCRDFGVTSSPRLPRVPEKREPCRPLHRPRGLINKILGKSNTVLSRVEARLMARQSFAGVCQRITEIDGDDALYCKMLAARRLKKEVSDQLHQRYLDTWRKILHQGRSCRSVSIDACGK